MTDSELDFKKSLPAEFFRRDAETAAYELLDKIMVRILNGNTLLAARIVETEAYLPENDQASHSYPGLTKRNRPMFEAGGILYIYKIYGIHHCCNIVTDRRERGSAVLIRAAEPLIGMDLMGKFRGIENHQILCKGPGNFAKAMNFSLEDNFIPAYSKNLYFVQNHDFGLDNVMQSRRIGINKASDLELRFFCMDSKYVSSNKKGKIYQKK